MTLSADTYVEYHVAVSLKKLPVCISWTGHELHILTNDLKKDWLVIC